MFKTRRFISLLLVFAVVLGMMITVSAEGTESSDATESTTLYGIVDG